MVQEAVDLDLLNVEDGSLDETEKKLSQSEEEALKVFSEVHATAEQARKEINQVKAQLKEKRRSEYQELAREYREVKEKLEDLPEVIQDQKDHISGLEETVETKKEELDLLESTMMMKINNAVDEDGKKKFSNKGMRQAELKRRKKESDEYQAVKEELKDAKRAKEQAGFELDKLYNQWKAVRKSADMLAGRMNMLAGVK